MLGLAAVSIVVIVVMVSNAAATHSGVSIAKPLMLVAGLGTFAGSIYFLQGIAMLLFGVRIDLEGQGKKTGREQLATAVFVLTWFAFIAGATYAVFKIEPWGP